jgi:hypothetical protein
LEEFQTRRKSVLLLLIPRTIVKVLGLECNTANLLKYKCNKTFFSGIIYNNDCKALAVILTWSKLNVIQIFSFSF